MEILKHNIVKIYGNRGKGWLSELSRRIEQLQRSWGLSELKPFPNLSYSYVLAGFQGSVPVILKLSPDANLIDKEAMALNAFEEFGAVSVLGRDEGDLHQENILSSGNSWVVIDPKGVIGSPIHEIWACVEDPGYDLKFLAGYFGYPLQDVIEWYYVRLILAACWQAEDGLDAERFLALAQSVLPMVDP